MILIAAPALADDLQALREQYYELRPGCRQGEIDGKSITPAESEQACKDLNALGAKLQDAKQCWDNGEQVWIDCPLVN